MTPKKHEALKRNAQKAGRKRKFQFNDRVVGRESAPGWVRSQHGMVQEPTGVNASEYYVLFDDQPERPDLVFTWWLDKVESPKEDKQSA